MMETTSIKITREIGDPIFKSMFTVEFMDPTMPEKLKHFLEENITSIDLKSGIVKFNVFEDEGRIEPVESLLDYFEVRLMGPEVMLDKFSSERNKGDIVISIKSNKGPVIGTIILKSAYLYDINWFDVFDYGSCDIFDVKACIGYTEMYYKQIKLQ